MLKLTVSVNHNGLKVLTAKAGTKRAFSLQTCGNLPITHGLDNNILANCATNRARAVAELSVYVSKYGTKTQKEALNG